MKLLCIGHALVDYFLFCKDEDTAALGLHLGSSSHVSRERMDALLERCSGAVPEAGGSASNVARLAAQLGLQSAFLGKCGTDRKGDIFRREMAAAGVECLIESSENPTGICITYLSGGRKTVATAHCAAGDISPSLLKPDHLEGVDILLVEGYLLYHREVLYHALRKAHEVGITVAFDPGNLIIIEDFREEILALLENYVDFLFLNEEESYALTELDKDSALELLGKKCRCVALKLGSGGSVVLNKGHLYPILPSGLAATDPTGAGDGYAAGFLFGVSKFTKPQLWGKAGSLVAGEVVQVPGTSIDVTRIQSLKKELNALT